MKDLTEIASNVKRHNDGIYYSSEASTVSYPEEGNANFMLIEEQSFWFRHRNNLIVQAVKKFCPGKTFFDIGGGNGFVAKGLQDAGIDVVLVEPGRQGAANASERNIRQVICSTLGDAGFVPASMDAVGLFDVVEHIPDDLAFLKEIWHYTRKGGFVFITVPAFDFLWSNEDDHAGHFRRYSRKQLEMVALKAGFQIEYSTYFFSILPLPVFFFRSIPSKLGIGKRAGDLRKNQKEHQVSNGPAQRLLQKIWDWELRKTARNKRIAFGGSCFLIIKK
jgi:SAM-dependent methyltransferase